MNAEWTPQRLEQLNSLGVLLALAARLNQGGGIIEKLRTIEDTAEALTRGEGGPPNDSFLAFLGRVAEQKVRGNGPPA